LGDLTLEFQPTKVKINANIIDLPLVQRINGLPAGLDTRLKSGDRVEIRPPATLGELSTLMDLDLSRVIILVDGVQAGPGTAITSSSDIRLETVEAPRGVVPQAVEGVPVTVNGRSLFLSSEKTLLMYALAEADIKYTEARGNLTITVNGQEADFTTALNPGDRVEVFWTSAPLPE
jgi:molybdopterin converting factor small subunit